MVQGDSENDCNSVYKKILNMKTKINTIREHSTHLQSIGVYKDRLLLRPMTEQDWEILLKWNQDPEVLYYSEGDRVQSYSLEDIHGIYRGVSHTAFCFIIELDASPIGECCLQKMNLDYVLSKYTGKDCRRIDLMIGEKHLWGKGIGTDVVVTLTDLGFNGQDADIIFGMVYDHNKRSIRAFEKVGYRKTGEYVQKPGSKANYEIELSIAREER